MGGGMAWRTPPENSHKNYDDGVDGYDGDDGDDDDGDDDDDVGQESFISSWGFVQAFEVHIQGDSIY